jgi:hypothetical protein
MFWKNVPLPHSGLKSKPSKHQARRKKQEEFAACFLLVSCLAYSSNPKMEAVLFFKTPVNIYQATLRHLPEDSTF